ncbi:MAG: endolytic transglycosylase MltG [Clostridiales bacterium]|nr:endolytic transglycosylase MltG [Clostridiales bacterium]
MKKILILLIILLLITGIGGFFYVKYYDYKNGKTLNWVDQYLIIDKDLSFEDGIQLLKEKELISSTEAIRYYAKYYKLTKPIKKGYYTINARTNLEDLLMKVQSGQSDFEKVTIPEGYTLYQIASLLEEKNLLKKEELLSTKWEELKKTSIIEPSSDVIYDLEGYLYPDTYYIPLNSSKEQIINKLHGQFLQVFNENYRNRSKELGLTVNEVVTIASLIEKEAANVEEMPRISGVIHNRLKANMLLQIDATLIYAHTAGKESFSPTNKHKTIDSKYNTYKYKEIPPGPIASPRKEAIEAALYPESHDFFYYVKGKDGHVFSKTYEEHLINVNKYLQNN